MSKSRIIPNISAHEQLFGIFSIYTTRNKNHGQWQALKDINIWSSWIIWMVHWQRIVTLHMLQILHDKHQIRNNFRHTWLLLSQFWHVQNLLRRCRSNFSIKIDTSPRKLNTGITIKSWISCTRFHKHNQKISNAYYNHQRTNGHSKEINFQGGTIDPTGYEGDCRYPTSYGGVKPNPVNYNGWTNRTTNSSPSRNTAPHQLKWFHCQFNWNIN